MVEVGHDDREGVARFPGARAGAARACGGSGGRSARSVAAWRRVSVIIRRRPSRFPAWFASVWRPCTVGASGGSPAGPIACSTPTAWPMTATGTQTAERPPRSCSRSRGHASTASESSNVSVAARRVAGQASGELTGHPGATPSGLLATARAKPASRSGASSSSTGVVGTMVCSARSTTSSADDLGLGELERSAEASVEVSAHGIGTQLALARQRLRPHVDALARDRGITVNQRTTGSTNRMAPASAIACCHRGAPSRSGSTISVAMMLASAASTTTAMKARRTIAANERCCGCSVFGRRRGSESHLAAPGPSLGHDVMIDTSGARL